jgi:hypothetical protein
MASSPAPLSTSSRRNGTKQAAMPTPPLSSVACAGEAKRGWIATSQRSSGRPQLPSRAVA